MNCFPPATGHGRHRLLQAGVLVLICALGGGYGVVCDSFAMRAALPSSTPEEEETQDHQPIQAAAVARKGGLRPTEQRFDRGVVVRSHTSGPSPVADVAPVHRPPLTGAGIFQHC